MAIFGKGSVWLWAAAVFVGLALAVYVSRRFPVVLSVVLIGELALLVFGVLGPVLREGFARGPVGRALLALVAVALANAFMLLLARSWGVDPHGWRRVALHWQDGPVRLVLGVLGLLAGFLDAMLRTVFRLGHTPLSGGLPHRPLGAFGVLALGAAASLVTAQVLRGLQSGPGRKAPSRR